MAEPDTTADPSAETPRDVTSFEAPEAKPSGPPRPPSSPPARTSASGLLAASQPPPSGEARAASPSVPPPPATSSVASDREAVTAPATGIGAAASSVGRLSTSARVADGAARASGHASAAVPPTDPLLAYEDLARSSRLGDLVAITQRIVGDLLAHGNGDRTAETATAVADAKLAHDDGATPFGNVFDVLGRGARNASERALASALWAHAVAEAPRGRADREESVAADGLWLATHSAFDATMLFDRALGEDAGDLWTAIADLVRRVQRDGRSAATESVRALGRGEAIVGCAALASSEAPRAKEIAANLARDLKDPVLSRILSAEHRPKPDVRIEGELVPAPRGPFATTLLAFSGLLFVIHGARLIARLALAHRCRAEVSLSESGVRVKSRTELLGRTLREREHVILRAGLVRVIREVRFPRTAFYAGLLALAVGSYVGVRAFVDGVRSASPSLLLVGLVIVAAGVGLDFVLGTLVPGSRGRCRIAFVPRTGPTLCVGDVDLQRADDALLHSLAKR